MAYSINFRNRENRLLASKGHCSDLDGSKPVDPITYAQQVITSTINWTNTGGNTMILTAQVQTSLLWQHPNGEIFGQTPHVFWAMVGDDGFGFYDTDKNPLNDDYTEVRCMYYISQDEYADTEYENLPAEYNRILACLDYMYLAYVMTNDQCRGF